MGKKGPCRDAPCQPAVPRGQTWHAADVTGSRAWGYFPGFFTGCTVMPAGYSFWEENLTAGQSGSAFLQPFCMEKPSKIFGATESYWGNAPTQLSGGNCQ